MKSLLASFLLLVSLYEAAGFRCDYTYMPHIEGWLKLHHIPTHHILAQRICLIEGGELVAPTTNGIETAIISLIDNTTISAIHIDFETVGEKNKVPQFLRDNEITNADEEAKEIWIMTRDRTFKSSSALAQYPFICHKKGGLSMELNECGTVDNEYTLDNRTGHCYKFHRFRNTWSRALEICQHEGGTLAMINSETEAQVIMDVFARNPTATIPGVSWQDSAFIGFSSEYGGAWKTVNGHPLSMSGYEKWAPGEPNNARGDELCGTVGRNGLLFDDPCNRAVPFICEMKIQTCDTEKAEEDKDTFSLPIPLKRLKLTKLIE